MVELHDKPFCDSHVVFAASKLWLPMLSLDAKLVTWCPQRLPELNPTTISADTKMQEAGHIADAIAGRFVADDKSRAAIKNLKLAFSGSGIHVIQHVSLSSCCTELPALPT